LLSVGSSFSATAGLLVAVSVTPLIDWTSSSWLLVCFFIRQPSSGHDIVTLMGSVDRRLSDDLAVRVGVDDAAIFNVF